MWGSLPFAAGLWATAVSPRLSVVSRYVNVRPPAPVLPRCLYRSGNRPRAFNRQVCRQQRLTAGHRSVANPGKSPERRNTTRPRGALRRARTAARVGIRRKNIRRRHLRIAVGSESTPHRYRQLPENTPESIRRPNSTRKHKEMRIPSLQVASTDCTPARSAAR